MLVEAASAVQVSKLPSAALTFKCYIKLGDATQCGRLVLNAARRQRPNLLAATGGWPPGR